jgi:hypothetical protein
VDETVDLLGPEAGADAVEAIGVRTAQEAVVEGLEGEAGQGGLALGPLVAVETQHLAL